MVMDFVIQNGNLQRGIIDGLDTSFNFTNFERFVNSSLARRFMGLDFERSKNGNRDIKLLGPKVDVVRVWEEIFRLVESKRLKVTQIKSVEQQLQYLRALGPHIMPNPAKMNDEYRDIVLPAVAEKLGLAQLDHPERQSVKARPNSRPSARAKSRRLWALRRRLDRAR